MTAFVSSPMFRPGGRPQQPMRVSKRVWISPGGLFAALLAFDQGEKTNG